ncbi:zinc finger CCCH domain-containing protein 13-like [Oncorhynchus tshawytscha]|uniref:zinc finger CCCH domain-containing protein 13-like n=1 Tax=Oncorhynchus tshawytscha TaxID=74940 RepID=UPI000D098B51|nr:zinc finger CCCH domain-containing protein 13-like [Oncorhynchus tshawytscha]
MLKENHKEKSANSRRRAAEVILEKLPPVKDRSRALHHPLKHQTSLREQPFEDHRPRERTAMNEWQQPYSQETFPQSKYSSQSRTHNSARTKYVYPEEPGDIVSGGKADGVDKAFSLKPVYHKRTLIIDRLSNDEVACKPNEFQRLPPYFPSPPHDHSEYDRRSGIISHRRPAEDPSPSLEENTNSRRVAGYKRSKGEQQRLDYERRMARKIEMDKLILQEKLLKTQEKVREMQQRERTVSGDNTKRAERHIRRPVEREKECIESKVSSAEQRRERERVHEMERRERLMMRDKSREDIEWQREKREELNRERREKKRALAEEWERLERMEREIVNKPEWSRDRRAEKDLEQQREKNGEWSRRARERENEKDTNWEREKIFERNRWEREKVKERERNGEKVEKKRDWEREYKWERSSRERYVSADDKRKERDIFHRGLDQEGQLKTAHRSVPGSRSSINCRKISREASHTSPSVHRQSSRLLQVELSPVESADNACLQLIPCRICHRKFAAERLEKHLQVCERMQRSSRKVFDSSKYRAKGTDLEEFMKTNSRTKSPELKKSNWRQKHEAFIRNLRQAHVPATGALHPQPPIQDNDDYVTCPHCARRFAPGPAERHIPKCQNIKSRPPPPRHRR